MKAYPGAALNSAIEQIRVLWLLPSPRLDDDICVRLENTTLQDSQKGQIAEYEALSYTWGETKLNLSIHINGEGGYVVTDNLFHALRRIRNRRKERALWIDALCINQSDNQEKSRQVSIMNRIYTNASRVLVWLGESELDDMNQDRPAIGDVKARHLHAFTSPLHFSRWIPHFVSATRNTRPFWWERAWVVQELACADNIEVLFGPCKMSLDGFYSTLFSLRDNCHHDNPEQEILYQNIETAFTDIRGVRKRYKRGKLTISTLFFKTKHTKATDAHDKVYSLMNLHRSLGPFWVKPDYDEPIAETFAKATSAIVAAEHNLNCFGYLKLLTGDHEVVNTSSSDKLMISRRSDLPSWAIDFTDMSFYYFGTTDFESIAVLWEKPSPQSAPRYLHGGRIELGGRTLGTIVQTILLPQKSQLQADHRAVQECGEILKTAAVTAEAGNLRSSVKFSSGNTRKQKDTSQAVFEQWQEQMFDEQRCSKFRGDYLANAFDIWEEAAGFPFTFPEKEHGLHLTTISCRPSDWYGDVEYYSRVTSGGCKVFALECGLVGVAPAGVEAGDLVVCLDGARLPIVLSPYSGSSEFVFKGFAYVHGLMERGRSTWSLRSLANERFPREDFVLR